MVHCAAVPPARVHLETERTRPLLLLAVGATGSHVTPTFAAATEPCFATSAFVVAGRGRPLLGSSIDVQADVARGNAEAGLLGTRSMQGQHPARDRVLRLWRRVFRYLAVFICGRVCLSREGLRGGVRCP